VRSSLTINLRLTTPYQSASLRPQRLSLGAILFLALVPGLRRALARPDEDAATPPQELSAGDEFELGFSSEARLGACDLRLEAIGPHARQLHQPSRIQASFWLDAGGSRLFCG